jgi:hypothetical protein
LSFNTPLDPENRPRTPSDTSRSSYHGGWEL